MSPEKTAGSLEDRVVELESKMAFLEKTVEDLNDVVTELGGRLETSEKKVQVLRTELQEGLADLPEEPGESA